MPNHTVSTNVDTMLRAADNAAIRTAIGLGTTDGPTFLNSTVVGLTSIFRAGTGTGFSSEFGSGGLALHSASQIAWSSSFSGFGAKDLALERDAAGILAQRNGVNAQAFRVYNTFPGTGNNEYAEIAWSGNIFSVRPAASGSGSIRESVFGSPSSNTYIDANIMYFRTSSSARWAINSAGGFLAVADNNYDIGASGGNRPRNIYVAGNIIPNGALAFSSQAQITAPAGSVYITSSGENMSGASNYIKSSNSNPFIIGTNNTERFTITSAGNVGIGDVTATGTRSPSAPFEVIKSTAVNGPMLVLRGDISGVGKWSSIAWGDQTQTNAFRKGAIIYESLHASVRGKLHISLNNTDGADSAGLSDARLTIAADGAVGVGASSPVNRLDIAETWNTIINVTGASGSGTIATITFATQTQVVPIGSTIVVAGINPAGYNGTFVVIASSTTALTYANATTATYVSGGTIERVFTSVKLNVTDTASNAASNLMDLQVGGVSKLKINKAGDLVNPTWSLGALGGGHYGLMGSNNGAFLFLSSANQRGVWATNSPEGFVTQIYNSLLKISGLGTNFITLLTSDADGILAQRNGTNAQAFRVYNTTDGTNTEYGSIAWIGGAFEIGSKAAGTGATRHTKISSVNRIYLNTGGADRWSVETTGHLLAGADNTYDIGASGANRPRTLYVGTSVNVTAGGQINLGSTSSKLYVPSGAGLRSSGPGIWLMFNDAENDFGRLQLGGTTSAFPAIKRVGAGIHAVLADESGYANVTSGGFYTGNVASLTGSGLTLDAGTFIRWNSSSKIYSPSDGVLLLTNNAVSGFTRLELGATNLGISRGTGSPEGVVTALVGSLYIRTDGGAATTLYVKESSPTPSTGWVAK